MRASPMYSDDELLSHISLAHLYENFISVFQGTLSGCVVNFVESVKTLQQNLEEVLPTVFIGVPRTWEKMMSNIEMRITDSTRLKRALYRLGIRLSLQYLRAEDDRWKRMFRKLLYLPFLLMVFRPLKKRIGFERIRVALCAGAPISPQIFEYFNALGIPLREAYMQTESTGPIAIQRIDHPRWGFAGEPIPEVEVRINGDGEILVRGAGISKGYFREYDIEDCRAKHGWLYTGDYGAIDDGFLKVLGRKSERIVTAGKDRINPSLIEAELRFSRYIQDALVFGNGRNHLVALILIDESHITKYAQDRIIPFTTFADLTKNAQIRGLIECEVSKVNTALSDKERIEKFELLPRCFYEEDGEVTPTKRLKRFILEMQFKDLIQRMYQE